MSILVCMKYRFIQPHINYLFIVHCKRIMKTVLLLDYQTASRINNVLIIIKILIYFYAFDSYYKYLNTTAEHICM